MDASSLNGYAVTASPEAVTVSQVSGYAVVSDDPTDRKTKVSALSSFAVVDNMSGRVLFSGLTAYAVLINPPPIVVRPQVFIT